MEVETALEAPSASWPLKLREVLHSCSILPRLTIVHVRVKMDAAGLSGQGRGDCCKKISLCTCSIFQSVSLTHPAMYLPLCVSA